MDRRQVKTRKRNSRAVLMARGLRIFSVARAARFVFVPLRRVIQGCVLPRGSHQNTATPASNGGFSPGVHLFPFRTEPLSPGAPMVLPSPVGESVAANLIPQCSCSPTPANRSIFGFYTFQTFLS